MAIHRKCFFSFHYKPDSWRAGEVRNIGVIEGNEPVSDNDWETVTQAGDAAIRSWINSQMYGRSCTIVLIGSQTAGRKWIEYEIKKAWNDGKGLLGIYIHNLKDQHGKQSAKGRNLFNGFKLGQTDLSNIVKAYDPPYKVSTSVYAYIKDNMADWVEEAIEIRNNHL